MPRIALAAKNPMSSRGLPYDSLAARQLQLLSVRNRHRVTHALEARTGQWSSTCKRQVLSACNNRMSRLQDKDSLMDCQGTQEEQEGRPGRPGRDKRAGENPTSCFKVPRSSWPSFWVTSPGPRRWGQGGGGAEPLPSPALDYESLDKF